MFFERMIVEKLFAVLIRIEQDKGNNWTDQIKLRDLLVYMKYIKCAWLQF